MNMERMRKGRYGTTKMDRKRKGRYNRDERKRRGREVEGMEVEKSD